MADQVGEVVGKPVHRRASHVEVVRQPFEWCSSSRPSDDAFDGHIDRREEGETQAGATLLVPACKLLRARLMPRRRSEPDGSPGVDDDVGKPGLGQSFASASWNVAQSSSGMSSMTRSSRGGEWPSALQSL